MYRFGFLINHHQFVYILMFSYTQPVDGLLNAETCNWAYITKKHLPYILESNPHPFYSFRGLKNQMQIRFAVESWILKK